MLYPEITPSEVKTQIFSHLVVGDTPYLHGRSGTGKTDLLKALCRDEDIKALAWAMWAEETGKAIPMSLPDLELVHMVLSVKESEDFIGVPWHRKRVDANGWETRTTVSAPSEQFLGDAPKFLFFDEVPASEYRVMKSLLGVLNDKEIDGIPLTPGTLMAMAGNLNDDRAGSKQVLFTLGSRAAHYQLVVSAPDWLEWGAWQGLDVGFLAFVKQHGEAGLHNFDSTNPSLAQLNPRTFTKAAEAYAVGKLRGLSENGLEKLVLAKIGQTDGDKLNTFLRLEAKLPKWEDLVANPTSAMLPGPGDPSLMYYLMGLLIDRFSGQDLSDADLKGAVAYWNRAMAANPQAMDASAWVLDSVFLRRDESEALGKGGAYPKGRGRGKKGLDQGFRFRLVSEISAYPVMQEKLRHFICAAQAAGF